MPSVTVCCEQRHTLARIAVDLYQVQDRRAGHAKVFGMHETENKWKSSRHYGVSLKEGCDAFPAPTSENAAKLTAFCYQLHPTFIAACAGIRRFLHTHAKISLMDFLNQRFISIISRIAKSLSALQTSVDAIRAQQETDAQQRSKEPPPAVPPIVLNAELQTPEHERAADREYQRKQLGWTKALVIATFLAFIAAAIYAAIAAAQLRDFDESIRQATRSADAAVAAAGTAERTLEQTRLNFIQDQRPYVIVLDIPRQPTIIKVSEKAAWHVTFVNFGRSPAVKARFNGGSGLGRTRRMTWRNFSGPFRPNRSKEWKQFL
ncbi:MAG: hypothetical protein JOY79_01885 [Acidobacteriaceae bacterium]|nr:hypothetical protein [Acidobacteriaceae bacterium]